MDDSVMQFYDQLAGAYHLIFADWRQAVRRQGGVLDGLRRRQLDGAPLSVLVCSCGIGTQTIGLAERGYRVHGTDISPAAVKRARQEAGRAGRSPLASPICARSTHRSTACSISLCPATTRCRTC